MNPLEPLFQQWPLLAVVALLLTVIQRLYERMLQEKDARIAHLDAKLVDNERTTREALSTGREVVRHARAVGATRRRGGGHDARD
jgi:hypothetical protein